MAYKTADLLKKSLEVIKSKRLIFIEEVCSFLPCTKKTFYEHKLHECDEILEAIKNNIVNRNTKAKDRVIYEKKHKKGNGYIYLIRCDKTDIYKIGVSKLEYKNRLSTLQSGCPFDLFLIHAEHTDKYSLIEYELHKKYRNKRVRGEWFKLNDKDIKDIIRMIKKASSTQITLEL